MLVTGARRAKSNATARFLAATVQGGSAAMFAITRRSGAEEMLAQQHHMALMARRRRPELLGQVQHHQRQMCSSGRCQMPTADTCSVKRARWRTNRSYPLRAIEVKLDPDASLRLERHPKGRIPEVIEGGTVMRRKTNPTRPRRMIRKFREKRACCEMHTANSSLSETVRLCRSFNLSGR